MTDNELKAEAAKFIKNPIPIETYITTQLNNNKSLSDITNSLKNMHGSIVGKFRSSSSLPYKMISLYCIFRGSSSSNTLSNYDFNYEPILGVGMSSNWSNKYFITISFGSINDSKVSTSGSNSATLNVLLLFRMDDTIYYTDYFKGKIFVSTETQNIFN